MFLFLCNPSRTCYKKPCYSMTCLHEAPTHISCTHNAHTCTTRAHRYTHAKAQTHSEAPPGMVTMEECERSPCRALPPTPASV